MSTFHEPGRDTDAVIGAQTRRAMLGTLDGADCNGQGASGWSRRSFLGIMAALAGGTVAGCSMRGAQSPDSVIGNLGGARRGGKQRPAALPDGDYSPKAPFALADECVLSEDYFPVANQKIDAHKDTVVAYSRADGEVEAMVLQGGVVKQIFRDPAQAGGWNVRDLPDTRDVTSMVAAVSDPYGDPKRASLNVYYTSPHQKDTLTVASQPLITPSGSTPTFTTQSVAWNDAAGPLQVTLNVDNTPFVAAMVASTAQQKTDARMYYCTDTHQVVVPDSGTASWTSSGYLTGFEYWVDPNSVRIAAMAGLTVGWSALVATPNATLGVVPNVTLYLPSFAYYTDQANPAIRIWVATLYVGRHDATPVQDWRKIGPLQNRAAVPSPTAEGYVASVEFSTVLGSTFEPTTLVRVVAELDAKTIGQRLFMLSRSDKGNIWTWTELPLPDPRSKSVSIATATRPAPASEGSNGVHSFLDIFLVSGGLLSVIRQAPLNDGAKDGTAPAYTPPIALQPSVALMTSQPGVSRGDELILVDTDGNLQALAKDPVSGRWADTMIHVPDESLQQVSTYRVQLTLTDSWNVALAGHTLKVAASTPATVLLGEQMVALTQDPTPLTTDEHGQVSLALVADGLSAPTLTITCDGLPQAATVFPSGPVNDYFTGTDKHSLALQTPFQDDTLAHATTPDGKLVAPGAASADADTRAKAFGNIKDASTLATAGSGVSARRSSTVGRRDGLLGTAGHRHARPGVGTQGFVTDVNNWAHDALHAIKKGAAAVSKVEHEAGSRVFKLTAEFENWTQNAVQVVVNGIEDAAHVLHAVFNQLAADIVHAVKWLEAEVLGLLRDSLLVAKQLRTWVGDCTTFAAGQMKGRKADIDHWLLAQKGRIYNDFVAIANSYAKGASLNDLTNSPPAKLGGTYKRRPLPKPRILRDDNADETAHPHGNWFLNKVKRDLLGGGLDLPVLSGLERLLADFAKDVGESAHDFEKAFEDFYHAIAVTVTEPQKAGTVGVSDILLGVANMVDGVIDFVRAILDALFGLLLAVADQIDTMLSTSITNLPIIGPLLKLADPNIDVSMHSIVTTIFAFPSTLAYKIKYDSHTRPFAGLQGELGAHAAGASARDDMTITAASSTLVWAGFDVVAAFDTARKKQPGALTGAVDVAAPLIISALTTPQLDGKEPLFEAPLSAEGPDAMAFMSWLCGVAPAFLSATGMYVDHYVKEDDAKETAVDSLMWAQTSAAVLSMVFGLIGAEQESKHDGWHFAAPIFNNLGAVFSLGLTKSLVDGTDGISALVMMALISVGGIGSFAADLAALD